MHPVLHDCLRYVAFTDEPHEFAEHACLAVSNNVALMTDKKYWVMQRRLLSQASKWLDWYQSSSSIVSQNLNSIRKLGAFFREFDRTDKAQWLFESSLSRYDGSYKDIALRATLSNLASIWFGQRQLEEAKGCIWNPSKVHLQGSRWTYTKQKLKARLVWSQKPNRRRLRL